MASTHMSSAEHVFLTRECRWFPRAVHHPFDAHFLPRHRRQKQQLRYAA